MMGDLLANLASIRRTLSEKGSGREITIVGVTKFQPLEKLKEAVRAGVNVFAVNYAQEGEVLQKALTEEDLEWHFIGHIQSRKVKYLPAYSCIQSLDRIEVAKDLNQRLEREGKRIKVCVEVNIGDEEQKSGVTAEALPAFLNDLKELSQLQAVGFMCMVPALQPIELRRPYFRKMAQIFAEQQKKYDLKLLSMGTSEDFVIAVEEGSNMVRLGTCLFGPRPPRS
jgi:PLP dependent protein